MILELSLALYPEYHPIHVITNPELACQAAVGTGIGQGVEQIEFSVGCVKILFRALQHLHVTGGAKGHAAASGQDVMVGCL